MSSVSRDVQLDTLVTQTKEWSAKATSRLEGRKAKLASILQARGVSALAAPLTDQAVAEAKADMEDL